MAMVAVMGVRSFRTETLKEYITAHVPVTFKKEKNVYKFKKLKNADNAMLQEVSKAWYEFNNKGEATPDIDIILRTKNFIKLLEGEAKGKVKEGQEDIASILRKHLGSAMDEIAQSATK